MIVWLLFGSFDTPQLPVVCILFAAYCAIRSAPHSTTAGLAAVPLDHKRLLVQVEQHIANYGTRQGQQTSMEPDFC